ncbi:28572_t:CDS:2 [Dentiscutata erythropus]|uniref:28572_t:CDS:1 n=1 Tax=Dentiscutata erythropus TaxID=1348616 RepID=A0A9N9ICH4_9GLOM|nr:28572_t:CDS:2 [Dentiscutata erythropus]
MYYYEGYSKSNPKKKSKKKSKSKANKNTQPKKDPIPDTIYYASPDNINPADDATPTTDPAYYTTPATNSFDSHLFPTMKTDGAQQLFPNTAPKVSNAKVGEDTAPISSPVSTTSSSGSPHTSTLSAAAATIGIAMLAFGMVGLFIHRKMNAGNKKDAEMLGSSATFNNKKPPDSPDMLQLMDTNNVEHSKETSYDTYSNEMNIPSLEPLSPLQLSPNNNLGSEILNDAPIIPQLVFANNNHSQDINTQPPARQSFYGESMYSAIYTTNQPLSLPEPSQSKSSFVDLSRSTAYPQSIPEVPVPFVAVSTTSDINNYDNVKETVRYSVDGANLDDADNYNYLVESEFIRPDSFLLNDSMNSPLDEKTNIPIHSKLMNDTSAYLPTKLNDVVIETSVVPTVFDSNIKDQPFIESNSIYQDSGNENQSNKVYANQNIQMDYVEPNQGTIHIETLDLNITDSTLAPAKESFDIQQNNIYDVTEGDLNDTSSPESPIEKPNIQIMKTEIVPVQSNMQIENIQDIIENNSEITNDLSPDTDSPPQTSETNPTPQMMIPATTVFVNPVQSKMKIEKVDNEPQSKPFISTPSAYIAERASAFTQSASPTTASKKTKKGAQKNKGVTDVDEKNRSSAGVDNGPNKVEPKKPAHRDSDQEPVPRKSILKNKVQKPQVPPQKIPPMPQIPDDLKISNELTATNNPVEKSEALYRSPTFSMYKMYDDLPGGRNSVMQPDMPQMPSSKPDNIESSENDS